MHPISDLDVRAHLHALTRDIGVRLAGSAGERRAADYVASAFERARDGRRHRVVPGSRTRGRLGVAGTPDRRRVAGMCPVRC